jgi:hypothetical protein
LPHGNEIGDDVGHRDTGTPGWKTTIRFSLCLSASAAKTIFIARPDFRGKLFYKLITHVRKLQNKAKTSFE